MAPSCCIELTTAERALLLDIARGAIRASLQGEDRSQQNAHGLTPALHVERGVFVTLTRHASLRGCIGTIHPAGPLAAAVADSACSAALRDPRFPQLRMAELAQTRIEISVLTPIEPLAVVGRADLLARLRPGADGLLFEDGRHRSTFLPKVWEQLPEPDDFLDQLLAKAGLPADHWSPSSRFHRYQALVFGDSPAQAAAVAG